MKFETILKWGTVHRKATVPFLWIFIGLWTIAAYEGCQYTLVQSPATVSVRGYTRQDGRTVNSYNRRPPGVGAADDRENARTLWIRVLIVIGWIVGIAAALIVLSIILRW